MNSGMNPYFFKYPQTLDYKGFPPPPSLTTPPHPSWSAPKGSAVVLCFKQDSPDKVNELYVKITEAGFKGLKAPWDAFWKQRYSSVLDPDGNQIDIFSSC